MDHLVENALEGDHRAIARLISLVENESPFASQIMANLYAHTGKAHIIGVTGSPGAGKSTLLDKLIDNLKRMEKKIGVIAVDPTSPFSGGAILGDRLRMQSHALEPDVFIRSMGTRGSLGGLSRAAYEAAMILDACGKDVIFIETVGVGQSEVDIVKIADTVCLLLVPGMGDDVQVMKAGIMEIADIFVINKADRDGADRLEAEVNIMLDLYGSKPWRPPIVKTVAEKGEGIDALYKALADHKKYLSESEEGKKRFISRIKMEVEEILRREIAKVVEEKWKENCDDNLIRSLASRSIDPYTVAGKILGEIFSRGL